MRRAGAIVAGWLGTGVFLCLLALAVRSFWHVDILGVFTPAGRLQGVAAWRGSAIFLFSDVPFGREMGLTAQAASMPAGDFARVDDMLHDPDSLKWKFAGFRLARGDFPMPTTSPRYTAITVPLWLFVLAAAVPTWRTGRRLYLRRRRGKSGLCSKCGYDLRGTPSQCPECGARPAVLRTADSPTNQPS